MLSWRGVLERHPLILSQTGKSIMWLRNSQPPCLRSRFSIVAIAAGLVVAAVFGGLRAAVAHPHVWIESRCDIVFNSDGLISAIRVSWEFDETYSAVAVEGLDTNADGHYDAEELQALAAENIEALEDYDYFTYMKVDGNPVAYNKVRDFGQYYKDGYLILYFTVPLKDPIDPRVKNVTYAIYDPTFYISIEPTLTGALQMLGAVPTGCGFTMRKSVAEADDYQYSEAFWAKADTGIGALFAPSFDIICKSKITAR